MTALHLANTGATIELEHKPGVTVRPGLLTKLSSAVRLNEPTVKATARAGVIQTKRLRLRPLESTDRAEFLRMLSGSRAFLSRFCPLSRDDADQESGEAIFERHLELSTRAAETGRAWRMTAFDAKGRIAGAFNVNDISRGLESTGELVFWVSAAHAGKGLGTEGVKATMDCAFSDLPRGLGLDKLTALVAPDNAACIGLMRRMGLRLNTQSPACALVLSGKPVLHDTYEAYAPVSGLVEGKPSIAENIFGRGLLSILKTESSRVPDHER